MGKRVVVIGGGVIGLSVAYACTQAGMKVTVLEREPATADGCSFGNAGLIVPSHFVPLAAPGMVAMGMKMMLHRSSPFGMRVQLQPGYLAWLVRFGLSGNAKHVARSAPALQAISMLSRSELKTWASDLGLNPGMSERGLLLICESEATLHHEVAVLPLATELGLQAEAVTAEQLKELQRGVDIQAVGGVYYADDAHIDPAQLVHRLRDALADGGAEVVYQSEVVEWHRHGNEVQAVKAGTRRFEADEFVLSAGVWSHLTARGLGLKLPLQPGRGHSITLQSPPVAMERPMLLVDARVAVTPLEGAVRFGGTMELGAWDAEPSRPRIDGLVQSVERVLPQFKAESLKQVKPWTGLRPCLPDGLPAIGRVPRWRNLTLATGHAMLGLSLAAGTGRVTAELLQGKAPTVDLQAFDPNRF